MTAIPDSTLVILFFVAAIASGVDAIAGGGGLMTLPALLIAGLDPVAALATGKLQSSAGSVSATLVFAWRGLIDARQGWPFALFAFVAAVIGAACVTLVPRDVLKAIVPLVLMAITAYFAFAHRPQTEDVQARLSPLVFAGLVNGGIGFYDGVFGPGTGSFLMIGFVTLLGFSVLRATAYTKLANAASNLGALAFFALSGKIVWPIGLVMVAGALIGGQVGSRLAIRHGARLIRPLIVTISCIMAIKLLLDPTNPLRHMLASQP